MPITNYQISPTYCKGFTLIEAVISMFIFVLVLATVSTVFTQAFSGYREGKIIQADLETAQFAINTMAKELRTSSIVDSTQTSVKFYDHSQGKCFRYQVNGTNLEVAHQTVTGVSICNGTTLANYTTVASGIIQGQFSVISSLPPLPSARVGKVTISLQIGSSATHVANIQTSVSLRDYGTSGL